VLKHFHVKICLDQWVLQVMSCLVLMLYSFVVHLCDLGSGFYVLCVDRLIVKGKEKRCLMTTS
jgi:hypothetical protein